jgi:hypothetical protein
MPIYTECTPAPPRAEPSGQKTMIGLGGFPRSFAGGSLSLEGNADHDGIRADDDGVSSRLADHSDLGCFPNAWQQAGRVI